jgi:tRNA threonylcarbamoyladenosine biosynthesis protein TsaB
MASRMLAFDTSADVTAVAVVEADRVLVEDSEPTPERHAETLLPRIEQCLERAGIALSEIDVFAVGVGPGSFTGVRVGVATAKGLALATGKPLRGVVSLAALAGSALECDRAAESHELHEILVAPILDAYKGEVFAALYSVTERQTVLLSAPFHAAPEAAAAQIARAAEGRQLRVLGSGWRRYAERIAPLWNADVFTVLDPAWDAPRARHVAREARRLLAIEGASDLARLAPLYVRDSDAKLPSEPLRV